MRDVGAGLNGWLQSMKSMRCDRCGRDWRVPEATTATTCLECADAQAKAAKRAGEAERVRAAVRDRMPQWLMRSGMGMREARASVDLIPARLAALLRNPALGVDALLGGRVPAHGFGLTGSIGSGKTFALGSILVRHALARWTAPDDRHEGMAVMGPWLNWSHWPQLVNALRVMSSEDGGVQKAAKLVRAMCDAQVFVVDDLGAERIGKAYTDDWATSQLDLIVDARNNAMLPTWYTTNLNARELVDRYGARMISRLTSENVLVQAPASTDLRVTGVKG